METSAANVDEENGEKPQNATEDKTISNDGKVENKTKNEETSIKASKDNVAGIEDEDLELSEVEASKDFGGNIDEDELLKDTEGDESCKVVTESSALINTPMLGNNLKGDVDSTDDTIHVDEKITEDEGEKDRVKDILQENSNTGDGIPDSSNGNLKNSKMDESFTLELNEDDEENECTSEDKSNTRTSQSVNVSSSERGLSEAETAVTSSSSGPVEKALECSLQNSLDTNNEINENSNSIISDGVENDSSNTVCKADRSNTETVENVSLNIDDESNEKTNTSHDDENRNKNDSSEGTKFLHIDQENSRQDESFEPMETGGEDPFAQTSDVAMDTSENAEKEGDLDKIDVEMDSSEDVVKGSDKADIAMDTSEIVEIEKDLNKSESLNSSGDATIVNKVTSDLAVTCEAISDVTSDSAVNSEIVNHDKPALDSAVSSETKKDVLSDSSGVCNEKTTNSTKDESIAESIKDGTTCTTKRIEVSSSGDQIVSTNEDSKKNNENVKKSNSGETTVSCDFVQHRDSELEMIAFTPTQKSKSVRQSGYRSKRRSSTEESSDSDFDLEDLQCGERLQQSPPKRTPKRSAAQRAESQIKVLQQIDQELKERIGEDAGIKSIKTYKRSDQSSNKTADAQSVEEIPDDEAQTCFTCKKVSQCKVSVLTYGKTNYFCDDDCFVSFRDGPLLKPGEGGEIIPPSTVMSQLKSADIQPMDRAEFVRKCSQCTVIVNGDDEKTLSWETMDFCTEECLGKYQQELGSHCANCKGNVQQTSLGKYCVRFGYEVKQFCCSTCLEEFKKGLKVCSFCQKDISSGAEGFLAPVGDKGTFKDFCTPACMEKYEQMSSNQPPPPQMHTCDVCNNKKLVEIEVFFDNKINKLCSDICFTAYKFANKLTVDRCDMCKKFFDKDAVGEKFNIFYEGIPHNFCCKTCMNVYILAKRKIVPCNWCKVKKYNFDMIKRVQNNGQVLMMCSLNCLTLYQVSVNAVSSKRIRCDMCNSVAQAQYHLTMSDATIRNFCTYPCVMNFQQQYSKSPITLPGSDAPPIPTGAPKRVVPKNDTGIPVPVISSVTSLANGQPTTATTPSTKPSGKLNLVARLCEPPVARNKFTQTRPIMNTKSVSCRPHSISVEVQTEEDYGKGVVPIPVPIYVPCPMAMYALPFPVPVPFPLPIPVPIFLPTTRNSIKGIMKEIKRIKEKVPEDPFEAELLMMAAMVAEDKEQEKTSSESEADADNDAAPSPANSEAEGEGDEDGGGGGDTGEGEGEEREFTPEGEGAESSNTFGDDIMQMALKIATELDTPATGEDLETQLPSSNIQQVEGNTDGNSSDTTVKKETRGRKRAAPATRAASKRNNSSESKKRKSHHNSEVSSQPSPAVTKDEPKPDANMKLKFTFGVNAWKSWVSQKNVEIEKLNATTSKKLKPFKTDMLQLTTDELNFSLCLFVKEVKKPNGTPYAPDTIYYLCLGIQQYLFENGRIDNIFTDSYFETFTDALDEVAKKFSELFNDHHYIVTRVEEEHLWESKQLGAHSPHVLLSTLMFFNTKHFNLTNVDEHLLLSFSHIMKHWKRNQNQSGSSSGRAPGSRNVLLRFYPPQSLVDDPNLKKKRVYEQQENEENPLRCPVKLYEFYLSKCPESVKNRNDVFYLQPERSCVPDSPVWYSTMALRREPLEKMLNRVKMVKEINIALLVP